MYVNIYIYIYIYTLSYDIVTGFHTRMQAQGLSGYTHNGFTPKGVAQIGPDPNRTHSQGVCVQGSRRI